MARRPPPPGTGELAIPASVYVDVRDGRYALTELGRAFLPGEPGTLMPFAVGAVLGAHMAERAAGLMRTGERPGESVLAERATILPWFGPMLEATLRCPTAAERPDTKVLAFGGTIAGRFSTHPNPTRKCVHHQARCSRRRWTGPPRRERHPLWPSS